MKKYSFGNNGLLEAVKNNKIADVRTLLAAGANVNFAGPDGKTPLHLASRLWYTKVVELLLAAPGINVNAVDIEGETPLHGAADRGHTKVVKLLLVAGANVNAVDTEGDTPLHKAGWRGNTGVVKLLLAAGANVNAVCEVGATPLYMAVGGGVTKVVELLLAQGANVNAADTAGLTPLHMAVEQRMTGVVKLLLAAPGINVNAVEFHSRHTPLHFAAKQGFTEIVKMLLDAGADISVRGEYERTALDLARERGHIEVVNDITQEDMVRRENRNKAGRIETGRGIPDGLISQYLAFGRTKGRATTKRPVSKKKSVANKTGLAKLKKTARKLGIRVTTKRNGKRVDKPKSLLSKQIAVRKKMVGKKLKSFGLTKAK